MLVKYRMLQSITLQQFRDDIVGLIAGTITNVSSLSAGCDKANSSISGTYPTGKYALVNATSNTFSKIHSTDGSTTDFFRLNFAANSLQSIALAQTYVSGTDTLVNSVANTVNIVTNAYNPTYPLYSSGLTMVIANSCIHFTSVTSGTSVGIHDLGESGVTATYPASMKMAFIRLDTIDQTGAASPPYTIPYAYTVQGPTSSFVTLTGRVSYVNNQFPAIQSNPSANSTLIVETPVFITPQTQSFAVYPVLGLLRIPAGSISLDYQYSSSNVTRQVAFAHAIVTE